MEDERKEAIFKKLKEKSLLSTDSTLVELKEEKNVVIWHNSNGFWKGWYTTGNDLIDMNNVSWLGFKI